MAEVKFPVNSGEIYSDGFKLDNYLFLGGQITHKLGSSDVEGTLYMRGMWRKAFGVKWLAIGNIILGCVTFMERSHQITRCSRSFVSEKYFFVIVVHIWSVGSSTKSSLMVDTAFKFRLQHSVERGVRTKQRGFFNQIAFLFSIHNSCNFVRSKS